MQDASCHLRIVAKCYKGSVLRSDWRVMTGADVSEAHRLSPIAALAKGTLAGRMLLTAWRCRRAPVIAWRANRADRADRPALPPPDRRRRYCAVYVVPTGPGEWPALRDTIESILHYEDADTKVVVADDSSIDSRAGVVRKEFPQVDVIRTRWPTSGGFRNYRLLACAVRACLARYDFDVLGKIDTDALITGPGLSARATRRFQENPSLGMLGTYGLRGDGVPEDYTLDRWLLSRQISCNRSLGRLVDDARHNGYTGAKCHGGIYFLARAALEEAERQGLLQRRMPWWLILAEDTLFSLMTLAAGYSLGSIGGPGESTISGQNFLPIPMKAVRSEGKLAIHSTRRGLDHETEEDLRSYFRMIRRQENSQVSARQQT